MTTPSAFDHRPDAELGEALRSALAAGDDAAFARRVVAAAEAVYGGGSAPGDWWDVLSTWARPAVAAALALAVAATFSLATASSRLDRDITLEEAFRPAGEAAEAVMLVAELTPPDLDRLLAVALENQ